MTSTAFCTTTTNGFRVLRPAAVLLQLAAFCFVLVLHAQTTAKRSAVERLNDFTAATSLDSFPKPWHLKVSVSLPVPQGAAKEGTIETWHAGPESRTVISFDGQTTSEYEHAGSHYASQKGTAVPFLISEVLDSVLHPGPESPQLTGAVPEERTQSFGKVTLDCMMLARPMKGRPGELSPTVPLGMFPTWCMVPQSDRLQIAFSFGNPTLVVTSLGKFGDYEVITGMTISSENTLLASAKVLALAVYVPTEGEFNPPPDVTPVVTPIPKLASGVTAGLKTGGTPPSYPASARMAHVSGSVVLRAIIGQDGHLQHLAVMSASDPDLAISALRAVHTWTYKPYLLNGVPTSVDTTITVNFNLNGS